MPADDDLLRATEELERRLRAFHASPDRCCRKGCLHCPEGRQMAWRSEPLG